MEPWEGLTSVGAVEVGRSFAESSEAKRLLDKFAPIAERASIIRASLAHYSARAECLDAQNLTETPKQFSLQSVKVGPTSADRISVKGSPCFQPQGSLDPFLQTVFENPEVLGFLKKRPLPRLGSLIIWVAERENF